MGERTQVSSLPLPPMQYVNLYSDESILRGRAPSPPKPIADGYTMFGAPFHPDDPIIRPLESQGIRRLHPQSYDPKRELKKLNHSVLVNFLDMLDILVKCPDTPKREEKKDDLNLLFVHMHHLINEFRPHQARETLRVMLEVQKKQRLETADRFQKHLQKVAEILNQTTPTVPDGNQQALSELLNRASRRLAEAQKLANGTSKTDEESEISECEPKDQIMCDVIDNIQ